MDEPKVEAQYPGENEAIKLLRLADGDFQIRTYRGKNDADGQPVDTYSDYAGAVREFETAAKVFLGITP